MARKSRAARKAAMKGNGNGGSKTQGAKSAGGEEVVDAEFEETVTGGESGLTKRTSPGNLGDLYNPGPISLLSEEAFEERIVALELEQRRIDRIKKALLVFDETADGSGDYGVIPGTKKSSLYQSGAEKFNRLFGLRPVYKRHRYAGDGKTEPHFRFLVECDLVDADGNIVGSGAGSCSNWEVKYRYRNAGLQCPECGEQEIRVSNFDEGGFYCWKKPEQGRNGCGAKFEIRDKRITTQTVGRVDNSDPFDIENTIQQMADKRAYVKATRTTHALSNTFTQETGGDDSGDPQPRQRRESTVRRDTGNGGGKSASTQVISEGQFATVNTRVAERAEALKESGITTEEIKSDLRKTFGLEKLEDLPQVKLPDVIKAIAFWEPPTGDEG